MKLNGKKTIFVLLAAFVMLVYFYYFNPVSPASAARVDELKTEINKQNKQMEQEINEYKEKLKTTFEESKNLKNETAKLENSLLKIQAEIKLSQNRIEAAELSLEELSFEIKKAGDKIKESKNSISETIRLMNEADSNSLVEILLANNSFADFFDNINSVEQIKKNIVFYLDDLKNSKTTLEFEQEKVNKEKENLEQKKTELYDRNQIQKTVQNQKQTLLKETQNKENTYKALLDIRLKKQKDLEDEIKKIEEELRVAIDPASLPPSRSGVLGSPVDNPVITQYFGNTAFATQNPQIYGGMGHNGVDFRASIGTSVKASEDGRVAGAGNTDISCKGVSYGKWILIEHNNNLSTLYSHLSLIKVQEGDIIKKGQIMGYSGDTGYVTGPHLHFAVFAAKAVKVSSMKSKVCGTIMILPIAPYNGYLNPLSYL